MTIILFAGNYKQGFGGMQSHMYNFIRFFSKESELKFVVYRNPLIVCVNNKEGNSINDVSYVIELLKEIKPTVFFFNDGYWVEEWEKLKREFPKVLFIYRTGGNEFVKAPFEDNKFKLKDRQELWGRLINKCMNFVISNSRFTTVRLMEQGVSENKILLVRGGVSLDICNKNILNKQELRREFNTEYGTQNKTVFTMVSRFEPFKGVLDVLKDFACYKERQDFFLLLVGDGNEKEAILRYCEENFDISQYCILNATDNVKAMEYIAVSDFYINCSHLYNKLSGDEKYIHTETMGRSLYEAIYQCVPVIATNVGGIRELFDEFEDVGLLIEDDSAERKSAFEKALLKQIHIPGINGYPISYGWDYIMGSIYSELFSISTSDYESNMALCLDIDGTIYHSFISEHDNKMIMKRLLDLSDVCEVIINSAANYQEILERYPIIADYRNRLIIISNCGKHLYLHGKKDIFWENYMEGIPGIQKHILLDVLSQLKNYGINIVSSKYVDKLYINLKVDKDVEPIIIEKLNNKLSMTEYMLVANKRNIKLISKIVNKAAPIRYLKERYKNIRNIISAGNNVLDFMFLDISDIAYAVNVKWIIPNKDYKYISITDTFSMNLFIDHIEKEIQEWSNG